jgi:hypothetical protein
VLCHAKQATEKINAKVARLAPYFRLGNSSRAFSDVLGLDWSREIHPLPGLGHEL